MSSNTDVPANLSETPTIRAVTLEGALWFPAVDVADAVGQRRDNFSYHINKNIDAGEAMTLSKEEANPEIRGKLFLGPLGRVSLVSESGLYKFILRAHPSNPSAKAFQDWVRKVVLPAFRKEDQCPQPSIAS